MNGRDGDDTNFDMSAAPEHLGPACPHAQGQALLPGPARGAALTVHRSCARAQQYDAEQLFNFQITRWHEQTHCLIYHFRLNTEENCLSIVAFTPLL